MQNSDQTHLEEFCNPPLGIITEESKTFYSHFEQGAQNNNKRSVSKEMQEYTEVFENSQKSVDLQVKESSEMSPVKQQPEESFEAHELFNAAQSTEESSDLRNNILVGQVDVQKSPEFHVQDHAPAACSPKTPVKTPTRSKRKTQRKV